MLEIIGQALGIVAMLLYVISYQFKKPALFYSFSFGGAAAFCVSYILLGKAGGCLCNVVSMIKALYLWLFPTVKRKAHFVSFIVLYAAVTVITIYFKWDTYLALLTLVASIAHTYMFFQKNEKVLRYIQIFVVSPLWIVYNTLGTEISIGGILCETFVVTSSIVYLIRHRKDQKEEPVEVTES
jgi:hypothetical protein